MVRRNQQMANNHRFRIESRYAYSPNPFMLYGFYAYIYLAESIQLLEPHCSEFLIHAADVEGLCSGIDSDLVSALAHWCTIPVTYAGGGRSIEDLELVKSLSGGKVDLTIGSALDIFGGTGVKFEEVCRWNEAQEKEGQ